MDGGRQSDLPERAKMDGGRQSDLPERVEWKEGDRVTYLREQNGWRETE